MPDFKAGPRSKVKRLHQRAHYDQETVYRLLDAGVTCHIAYVIDGQPYCTPTAYWRHGNRVYWHGSSASRMLREQAEGLPVCLTATHFDGLVVARSGFHCSMNYRSVMLFGEAHMLEDAAEKQTAVEAYITRLMPGRAEEMRAITAQEIKATKVIFMEIEEASAKVRNGPPADDEEDYALPIWAGVIPFTTVIGEAEACPRVAAGTPTSASLAPYAPGRALDEVLSDLSAAS